MIGIVPLNRIADEWLEILGRASCQGGLALTAAWVICLAATKLPARFNCWVWRVAYLKLLVVGLWISPLLLPLLPAARPQPSPPVMRHVDVERGDEGTASFAARERPGIAPRVSAAGWLFVMWSVGVAAGAAHLLREWRATIRLRRRCHVVNDAGISTALEDLCRRLGVRRLPRVLCSHDLHSPLLVGIVRPTIIVPLWLLKDCSRHHARLMLAHELAHRKRLDLLWAWLPRVARVVFFFHPLVWLTQRQWKLTQEIACDALAIAATRAAPADYGGALLTAARHVCAAPAVLAIGVVQTRKTLERRLIAMRTLRPTSRRRAAILGFALLTIALLGIVPWKVVAQESLPQKHRDRSTTQPEQRAEATTKPVKENSYVGILTARTVELRARTDGVLNEVRCREGEQVSDGSVLFEVNSARAKAAYDEAELAAAVAKQKYQHVAELIKSHSITEDELGTQKVAMETAATTLVIKREELEDAIVRAPFAGVVASCDVVKGQSVTKNTVLATLVEADVLRVKFDVTVLAAAHLHLWDKFRVRVDIDGSEYFEGEVMFIAPQVDPQTQTISIKGTVKSAGGKLKPGMAVTVLVPNIYPGAN